MTLLMKVLFMYFVKNFKN